MTSQHQRFATFALVLAIALGTTSMASAAPTPAAGTYEGSSPTSMQVQAPVASVAPDQGFDWSAAVIGAGVAIALTAIGFGAVMLSRSTSTERARFHLT